MEQTKALNALEPFIALSKSATSPRAAADLVTRATSAPNTFIFTELLQTPQIQSLASSDEFSSYLTLLQTFSHGIYADYTANVATLPALNDEQKLKLRQLSLLTLVANDGNNISGPPDDDAMQQDQPQSQQPSLSYASLSRNLELSSARELEELIISAIYAGLIEGQLDPANEMVQINSVAALRDVPARGVGGLLSSLQGWAGRCEATLQELEATMANLREEADRRAAEDREWNNKMSQMMENEQQKGAVPSSSSPSMSWNRRGGGGGHGGGASAGPSSGPGGNFRGGPRGGDFSRGGGSYRPQRGISQPSQQYDQLRRQQNHHHHHHQSNQSGSNSLLTSGGGSYPSFGEGPSAVSPPAAAGLMGSSTSYATMGRMEMGSGSGSGPLGKRGSSDMDDSEDIGDDTMELDDEGDDSKRGSKRKLTA